MCIRDRINGVTFINDTAATVPQATIKALLELDEPAGWGREHVILIAGGKDKNLDYTALSQQISTSVKQLFMFEGTASEKLQRCLEGLGAGEKNHQSMPAVRTGFKTMTDIIRAAMDMTRRGDIVLLSPGAASFDMFANEFDRGRQFVSEAKKFKSL